MPTNEKTHHPKSLVFDTLMFQDFDNLPTVAASTPNTTPLAYLVLPQRSKIFKVALNYTAITSTAGTIFFNIVVNVGAETSANTVVDTIITNSNSGTMVFAADQALTNAVNTPMTFTPTQFDTIYEAGTLLTVRAVTPAANTITNLKISMALKFLDAGPSFTGLYPF